jgi:hypothetical protein
VTMVRRVVSLRRWRHFVERIVLLKAEGRLVHVPSA